MAKVILIASGKGGVGKSTVSALLGEALAFAGHPTLLAELDSGLRSLDVALGVTAGVLFDMGDVARGCAPADAVMQCPFCEKLSLICASASNAAVDEKTISTVINAFFVCTGRMILFQMDGAALEKRSPRGLSKRYTCASFNHARTSAYSV